MLHIVIMRHTAESCPGLFEKKGITRVGGWADPPAHVSWIIADAPTAHSISEALMESGLAGHTTTEIRPVMSMD